MISYALRRWYVVGRYPADAPFSLRHILTIEQILAFANQAAVIVLVVAAGAGLAPMEVMSTPGALRVYFKVCRPHCDPDV